VAEEEKPVEAEEHIKALARIFKPKPRKAEHGGAGREVKP